MIRIVLGNVDQHSDQIRDLFWEYLNWANEQIFMLYGLNFDIAAILEDDMQNLERFMPPMGRMALGFDQQQLLGMACLKALTEEVGEIKRMYVRPLNRQKGLGRALLARLLVEADQIGYRKLRLDSALFMYEAHSLYRSAGFCEIEAYPGSEIPKEYQAHWIFMELSLKQSAQGSD